MRGPDRGRLPRGCDSLGGAYPFVHPRDDRADDLRGGFHLRNVARIGQLDVLEVGAGGEHRSDDAGGHEAVGQPVYDQRGARDVAIDAISLCGERSGNAQLSSCGVAGIATLHSALA